MHAHVETSFPDCLDLNSELETLMTGQWLDLGHKIPQAASISLLASPMAT